MSFDNLIIILWLQLPLFLFSFHFFVVVAVKYPVTNNNRDLHSSPPPKINSIPLTKLQCQPPQCQKPFTCENFTTSCLINDLESLTAQNATERSQTFGTMCIWHTETACQMPMTPYSS